jgi:uncharacterized protein
MRRNSGHQAGRHRGKRGRVKTLTRLNVIGRDTAGRATRVQVARDEGIKVGDVRLTAEGYMIAEDVPVARTGVQEYSALELGLDASMKTIRLYRPPEEVFSAASMATLDRKPVTFYHPEHGVDSSNWKQTAVGRVETPSQDGDFLDVKVFEVNDQSTVEAVAFGVKEVSCGYSFTLDMKAGTTPAGEAYDGVQRNIEHNHVAIVYAGRCGAGCAIGDCACATSPAPKTTNKDNLMKITVSGIDLTLDDKDAAIVKKALDDGTAALTAATKRATDAETALAAQGEAMKNLATDHKAALDAEKAKQATPEQFAALVSETAATAADALSVIPDFVAKGKSPDAMRVEVLTSVLAEDGALKGQISKILGGTEPAKAGDVRVKAAFDTVVALSGSTVDSGAEDEIVTAFTGDKKTGAGAKTQKLSGRALMIARSRGAVAQQ